MQIFCLQDEPVENVTGNDDIKPQHVASIRNRSVAHTSKVGCCVYGTNHFLPEFLCFRHFSIVHHLSYRMSTVQWSGILLLHSVPVSEGTLYLLGYVLAINVKNACSFPIDPLGVLCS